MKYYLWVRWTPECKEAFAITKDAADWLEKNTVTGNSMCRFSTPSGTWLRIHLFRALAYKVITREVNPLEDMDHYDNELN